MYLLDDYLHNRRLLDPMIQLFAELRIKPLDFKRELSVWEQLEKRGERIPLNQDDGIIGIILTKSMLLDIEYLYFLELIHSMHDLGGTEVIATLIELEEHELPKRLQWLGQTRLSVIRNEKDRNAFCYFCAGRILRQRFLKENMREYMSMLEEQII